MNENNYFNLELNYFRYLNLAMVHNKCRNLLWHYRSKHESLITFSNHEYYDNSLLPFPSPDNRTSKVTFVKVDGYYDRAKSRCNPAEAKAVIEDVERRLSAPKLSKFSIGIVTFSIVQQHLIDDLGAL